MINRIPIIIAGRAMVTMVPEIRKPYTSPVRDSAEKKPIRLWTERKAPDAIKTIPIIKGFFQKTIKRMIRAIDRMECNIKPSMASQMLVPEPNTSSENSVINAINTTARIRGKRMNLSFILSLPF